MKVGELGQVRLSNLFMETITVSELVGYIVTDSKLLKFNPEKEQEFKRILLGKRK